MYINTRGLTAESRRPSRVCDADVMSGHQAVANFPKKNAFLVFLALGKQTENKKYSEIQSLSS